MDLFNPPPCACLPLPDIIVNKYAKISIECHFFGFDRGFHREVFHRSPQVTTPNQGGLGRSSPCLVSNGRGLDAGFVVGAQTMRLLQLCKGGESLLTRYEYAQVQLLVYSAAAEHLTSATVTDALRVPSCSARTTMLVVSVRIQARSLPPNSPRWHKTSSSALTWYVQHTSQARKPPQSNAAKYSLCIIPKHARRRLLLRRRWTVVWTRERQR